MNILAFQLKNKYYNIFLKFNYNLSLCENNCSYYGYISETKQAVCKCEIKENQINISEVNKETNILSNNFTNDTSSNMATMKCYYTLFTVDGIKENFDCYILIFIIISFGVLSALFYKCGYP